MTTNQKEQLSESNKQLALYLAKAVRDGIEDFHAAHISDDLMPELNTAIRDALATALHAHANYETSPVAQLFFDSTARMIPDYWEEPRLQEGYLEALDRAQKRLPPFS